MSYAFRFASRLRSWLNDRVPESVEKKNIGSFEEKLSSGDGIKKGRYERLLTLDSLAGNELGEDQKLCM